MSPSLLAVGAVIDDFRLDESLPLAATASFWRVSQAGNDTPLLMKIPRLEHGANPINIVGFEAEQMILPKLSGPHVPRFVKAGTLENPYIVMEMIEGDTLKALLARLPLRFDEVALLGADIATALHSVHRQEVVHLDVKPSNLMVRRSGETVLIDFGFSHHARLPDILAEEFPARSEPGRTSRPSSWPETAAIHAATSMPSARCCISSPPASGRSATRKACTNGASACIAIRFRLAPGGPIAPRGCRRSSCAASKSIRHNDTRQPRSSPSICSTPGRSPSPSVASACSATVPSRSRHAG